MAIAHAVLALLADGPAHGYSLRTAFEQSVGPQWGGLNIGHLYQVLDRLARDGHVTSSLVPQSVKPDRRVYALTDAGRAELERWLAAPVERTGGYRDDLMLKVLAAARVGEDAVLGVLDRQRRHELLRLKGLHRLARQHVDAPLVELLVEAAILHTKADLALLDRAEVRAAALAVSTADVSDTQRAVTTPASGKSA